jgi:hypothetical protein
VKLKGAKVIGAEPVVGYLTVYLMRGARQVADQAFDALLKRLARLVEDRIGPGPLDDLAKNPKDPATQTDIRRTIESQAMLDPSFASALRGLVAELDAHGGQSVIAQTYARIDQPNAQIGVQVVGPGAGRDYVYAPANFKVSDPSDLSDTPAWAKFLIVAGMLTAIAGLGIFFFTMFNDASSPSRDIGGPTPHDYLGFEVFFVGFVITAVGSIGRAMSNRS